MNKTAVKWFLKIGLLVVLLLGVVVFSLCVGAAGISFGKIWGALFGGERGVEYSILMKIRFPRIVLGFAVGGGLSLAGVLLQGMFRNPLVEPYTLGISGGAALGVCLNIVFGVKALVGSVSLPVSGFMGAVAVILALYGLSVRRGVLRIQGLLLTGVMISFITSAVIMLLMSVSEVEDLQEIVFWIMGSLEEPSWNMIVLVLGLASAGLLVSYMLSFRLNGLSLGEDEARNLGIDTAVTKRLLFVIAALLTGCCVSVTGIIGFVGLVVPHFARMFLGRDHRILLLGSFLSGAVFLIACDTLARTVIAPVELPVGVITGILGGSLFVYALNRRGKAL